MSEGELERAHPTDGDGLDFLDHPSEAARLVREFDWSSTPLGAPAAWSASLRMIVRFMFANRFPLLLWWGPDYIQIYNDAYAPILGTKHPKQALGKPFRECWHEVYDVLGPLVDTPFQGGPSTWMEDIELIVRRHGFPEESHFTIAYSPVPDDSAPRRIGGVLGTVHEITDKVIGERRVKLLSELGAQVSEGRTAEDACVRALDSLSGQPKDIPFAVLYLLDDDPRQLRRVALCGIDPDSAGPATIRLDGAGDVVPWPVREALDSERIELRSGFTVPHPPAGPWPDAPDAVAALPIKSSTPHRPAGVLVAGISACIRPDERYTAFLELVGAQIASAVANARAYQQERRRAEELEALDRAKTAFFTNVSHEFRTPLTLMLGPLETLKESVDKGAWRELAATAQHNAQRLLRLVNTLLDYARVEGGRADASFEPVDLSVRTAELASTFRSACEQAGLALDIDCAPLEQPVYVDPDQWERIVLNLISNAFKFTLEGRIAVSVCAGPDGRSAELKVRDTGSGIPAGELPRLFSRFHRVEGSRGRSFEGSGIGLALVHELVGLHGGSIRAESTEGAGSTFTVCVPFGCAHLPADRVRPPSAASGSPSHAAAFVDEALHWLPQGESATTERDPALPGAPVDTAPRAPGGAPRILVIDDNADLRRYVAGLLEAQRYAVETAADGLDGLAIAQADPPDLVLADVMMPRLDGFGLVARLRDDARTRTLPVILLSARAGEESRVEGLGRGADDYLVKPFSARELVARVGAHLAAARVRQEAARSVRESDLRFRALVTATSDVVYRMNADWTQMRYLRGQEFIADTVEPSTTWLGRYIPPEDHPRVASAIEEAVRSKGMFELEHRVIRVDGGIGWAFSRAIPILGENGEISEWFGAAKDVTGRRQADDALRASEARYRALFESMDQGFCVIRLLYDGSGRAVDYRFVQANRAFQDHSGLPGPDGRTIRQLVPDFEPQWIDLYAQVAATGRTQRFEASVPSIGGTYDICAFVPEGYGEHHVAVLFTNITERRRAEERLHASEEHQAFLLRLNDRLRMLDDAEAIQFEAVCALGRHLRAARAGYAEDQGDGQTVVVTRNYVDGVPGIEGRYRYEDYGPGLLRELGAGRVVVRPDIANDPGLTAAEKAAHAALQLGATFNVPLVKGDRLVAILFAHHREAHAWTAAELALMDEVAQRTWSALERARAEQALRDALRNKDEFLATLAHELRNPLAPIRNALQLLRIGATPAERVLEMLERQVNHMVRLIDDLMEVSRISRGMIELRREPLDLRDALRSAVETSKPLIDRACHRFALHMPEAPLPVQGDAVRLSQVFANLLNNAAKYTEDGGEIEMTVRREAETAVVTLRDSGIGIAADALPRVFEMFAQFDAGPRSQGGLGIGLALVRRLVQLHGGSVEAASRGPGCGSSFVVRLPLAPGGFTTGVAAARSADPRGLPRRILVVDDNRDAADSLAMLFRFSDCEVRVAHDGVEALALFAQWEPGVVVLDLGMPGMDGFEVARRIRDVRQSAKVTLIALSGWGQQEDRQRTREAGFDHHLIKPVDFDVLRALLATLDRDPRIVPVAHAGARAPATGSSQQGS
jgi:signal transduction histidine kinase/DNA-binding response OmpR family regulator